MRAVLGCAAGNAVLQVLGVGTYPAVLSEASVMPAVRNDGTWGWREGRGGQCLTHNNSASLRCSNYSEKHPAWVRWCPEAVKASGASRVRRRSSPSFPGPGARKASARIVRSRNRGWSSSLGSGPGESASSLFAWPVGVCGIASIEDASRLGRERAVNSWPSS